MSHFTVAVFHKRNERVADILEPFYENAKIEFESAEDEIADLYENNSTVDAYLLPNGTLVPEYHDSLYTIICKMEYEQGKAGEDSYLYTIDKVSIDENIVINKYKKYAPNKVGAVLKEVTIQELYPTLDDYRKNVDGYDENDVGEKGYWYNPNAKWDWYQIGGRWNGLLRLKPDKIGFIGENGLGGGVNGEKPLDDNQCSSAYVKDVDFSSNQEKYDKSYRWWQVVVEGQPLRENEKEEGFHNFYKIDYLKKRYGDADGYAKSCSIFSTYAVIKNGKWYEPGEMGWFGCSSATVDAEREWDENYHKFYEDTEDDDMITIVDCHI